MMRAPVAMLLRRPRASPIMDVVMAPRKQPTGDYVWILLVHGFSLSQLRRVDSRTYCCI